MASSWFSPTHGSTEPHFWRMIPRGGNGGLKTDPGPWLPRCLRDGRGDAAELAVCRSVGVALETDQFGPPCGGSERVQATAGDCSGQVLAESTCGPSSCEARRWLEEYAGADVGVGGVSAPRRGVSATVTSGGSGVEAPMMEGPVRPLRARVIGLARREPGAGTDT